MTTEFVPTCTTCGNPADPHPYRHPITITHQPIPLSPPGRCVFCAIIEGAAPATIVAEWPDAIAIVPLGPVVDGHILVIPRQHVTDYADQPAVTAATMQRAAEYTAGRHPSANLITSMGEAATQSVFHLHVHVVPRTADDNLMVPWGTVYGDDPRAPHWCAVAQQLRDELDRQLPGPADPRTPAPWVHAVRVTQVNDDGTPGTHTVASGPCVVEAWIAQPHSGYGHIRIGGPSPELSEMEKEPS